MKAKDHHASQVRHFAYKSHLPDVSITISKNMSINRICVHNIHVDLEFVCVLNSFQWNIQSKVHPNSKCNTFNQPCVNTILMQSWSQIYVYFLFTCQLFYSREQTNLTTVFPSPWGKIFFWGKKTCLAYITLDWILQLHSHKLRSLAVIKGMRVSYHLPEP